VSVCNVCGCTKCVFQNGYIHGYVTPTVVCLVLETKALLLLCNNFALLRGDWNSQKL